MNKELPAKIGVVVTDNVAEVTVSIAPGIMATIPFQFENGKWVAFSMEGVESMLADIVERLSKQNK